MATIYIIRNTVNDYVYIGSTTQSLKTRLREHKSRARTNKKYYVYDMMREIGIDNFYIEPLQENVLDSERLILEQEYIKSYPNRAKLLNTQYGISYSDIDFIINAYNAGKRVKEIAKERNHDAKNVSRILKENGIELRDWNSIQRIDIDKDTLNKLYTEKMMTTVEIAKEYNTSHQTILKKLKLYNIPIRKAVNRKYLK